MQSYPARSYQEWNNSQSKKRCESMTSAFRLKFSVMFAFRLALLKLVMFLSSVKLDQTLGDTHFWQIFEFWKTFVWILTTTYHQYNDFGKAWKSGRLSSFLSNSKWLSKTCWDLLIFAKTSWVSLRLVYTPWDSLRLAETHWDMLTLFGTRTHRTLRR